MDEGLRRALFPGSPLFHFDTQDRASLVVGDDGNVKAIRPQHPSRVYFAINPELSN